MSSVLVCRVLSIVVSLIFVELQILLFGVGVLLLMYVDVGVWSSVVVL